MSSNHDWILRFALALTCLTSLQAQSTPDPNLIVERILDSRTFFVPIRTVTYNEAVETWGGGLDYKASFHGGFRFFARGEDKIPSASLSWQTGSVTIGEHVLMTGGENPTTAHTGQRFEYRFANVHEIYDADPSGVEQSFWIGQRPKGEQLGDLVIRGKVQTGLEAAARKPVHGPLVFGEDGGVRIHYGKAIAIDAAGNRCDVATGFEDGVIELRVDGGWVDKAVFPIVVDPVIRRVFPVFRSSRLYDGAWHVHVVRENVNAAGSVMFAFSLTDVSGSRTWSDSFVYEFDQGFRHGELVWADISADRNTSMASGVHVGAADTWLFLLELPAGLPDARARHYELLVLPSRRNPDPSLILRPRILTSDIRTKHRGYSLGGTATDSPGTRAILVGVRETDAPDGYLDAVVARSVDARLGVLGTESVLDSVARTWISWSTGPEVAVNAVSDGDNEPWVVAWRTSAALRCVRVYPDGIARGPISNFTQGTSLDIAGARGRYLLVRQIYESGTLRLVTTRFDLSVTNPSLAATNVRDRELFRWAGEITRPSVAYDANTLSHWCVVYGFRRSDTSPRYGAVIDRLGFTGGNVEREVIFTDARQPNIGPQRMCTFDAVNSQFMVVTMDSHTETSGSTTTIWTSPIGARLVHEMGVGNYLYGSGCGAGTIYANDRPYAGHGLYNVQLRDAPTDRVAILHMSGRADSYIGPDFRYPGCTRLVDWTDPRHTTSITRTNAVSGRAAVNVQLPDSPVLIGNLYFQWEVWGDPASTRLWSGGLRAEIKP